MELKHDKKILFEIFNTFFKIGAFTFGGGFAMMPLIEKEVVDNKKWVTKEEIIDIFAISQSIPGAIAINSSTLIGYKVSGKKGAVMGTLGVVLPAFSIITIIAAFFTKLQDKPVVEAAFGGIRASIVALIITAAISVSKTAIKDRLGVLIALITVFIIMVLNVSPIIAIIGGGLFGIYIYKFMPNKAKEILERDEKKK